MVMRKDSADSFFESIERMLRGEKPKMKTKAQRLKDLESANKAYEKVQKILPLKIQLAEAGDETAQGELSDWMHSLVCGVPFKYLKHLIPTFLEHEKQIHKGLSDEIHSMPEDAPDPSAN